MLGDLIANLDRPDVARAVLATLDPNVAARVERRAAAAAMIAPDFVAGAVREFVERADDELWLQLLNVMRKAKILASSRSRRSSDGSLQMNNLAPDAREWGAVSGS